MSKTTIALTGAIADYYATHSHSEPEILAELRKRTAEKASSNAGMQIAPDQGAFMAMLASLMNAKEILEIGTFTGYSSLAMALGSKANVTAVDVSDEWTSIAREFWQKAGVTPRITLRLDGGHAAIADLLAKGRAGQFDLCFIDADKVSYDAYYEGALKLLRVGGLIMIDNVLWGGAVADAAVSDDDTVALRTLNKKIKSDQRISLSMVPIGDGLTLAQKR